NNSGTVVFEANRTVGLPGIFTSTGTGQQPTNINGLTTGNFVGDLGVPAINETGQVVFNAYSSPVSLNLYVGSGGTPTPIASSNGNSADINNSATVTWSTSTEIMRWKSGTTTTIASSHSPFDIYESAPAINATGNIVFGGFRSTPSGSIVG